MISRSALIIVGLSIRGGPEPAPLPDERWTAALAASNDWTGGDGCATLPLDPAKTLWLFSDSIVGPVKDGKHAPGSAIINNSAATSDAPGALSFAWAKGPPPKALFTPAEKDRWYWMAGGGARTSAKGPLVLFLWSMSRTGAKDPGVWDFKYQGLDAAVIVNPDAEPAAWTPAIVHLLPADGGKPGRTRSWGAAVLPSGDWVYIFGADVTNPRDKQLLIARCPAERLAETAVWTFWNGSEWSVKPADAAAIADGAVDEFSVSPLKSGGFVLIQSEPNLGRRLGVRNAAEPQGPWTAPRWVYDCPEPAKDRDLIIYSARGHPEIAGEGLLVSYCVNSTNFGKMWNDATIYRPRFIRIPEALLAKPR